MMTFIGFCSVWNYIINGTVFGLGSTFVVRQMRENKKRRGR